MNTDTRTHYTGFYFWYWAVVTALLGIGSLAALASQPSAGLGGLAITGAAGLYARYLCRGGRWRMLFFVI